jgi:tRNA(Ser,Leu) C12 N-acetylase TAN1
MKNVILFSMEVQVNGYLKKEKNMVNNAVNLENIWGTIGAVTRDEVRIAVLRDEIEIHKSRLQPHDTGHLHDTIAVIKRRIEELT